MQIIIIVRNSHTHTPIRSREFKNKYVCDCDELAGKTSLISVLCIEQISTNRMEPKIIVAYGLINMAI